MQQLSVSDKLNCYLRASDFVTLPEGRLILILCPLDSYGRFASDWDFVPNPYKRSVFMYLAHRFALGLVIT